MNKSKLKTYALQARKDFIAAVTARANLLGLSEAGGKLEVAPGEKIRRHPVGRIAENKHMPLRPAIERTLNS